MSIARCCCAVVSIINYCLKLSGGFAPEPLNPRTYDRTESFTAPRELTVTLSGTPFDGSYDLFYGQIDKNWNDSVTTRDRIGVYNERFTRIVGANFEYPDRYNLGTTTVNRNRESIPAGTKVDLLVQVVVNSYGDVSVSILPENVGLDYTLAAPLNLQDQSDNVVSAALTSINLTNYDGQSESAAISFTYPSAGDDTSAAGANSASTTSTIGTATLPRLPQCEWASGLSVNPQLGNSANSLLGSAWKHSSPTYLSGAGAASGWIDDTFSQREFYPAEVTATDTIVSSTVSATAGGGYIGRVFGAGVSPYDVSDTTAGGIQGSPKGIPDNRMTGAINFTRDSSFVVEYKVIIPAAEGYKVYLSPSEADDAGIPITGVDFDQTDLNPATVANVSISTFGDLDPKVTQNETLWYLHTDNPLTEVEVIYLVASRVDVPAGVADTFNTVASPTEQSVFFNQTKFMADTRNQLAGDVTLKFEIDFDHHNIQMDVSGAFTKWIGNRYIIKKYINGTLVDTDTEDIVIGSLRLDSQDMFLTINTSVNNIEDEPTTYDEELNFYDSVCGGKGTTFDQGIELIEFSSTGSATNRTKVADQVNAVIRITPEGVIDDSAGTQVLTLTRNTALTSGVHTPLDVNSATEGSLLLVDMTFYTTDCISSAGVVTSNRPDGLHWDVNGELTGTPTTNGTWYMTAQYRDAGGQYVCSQVLTLTVED